MTQRVQAIGCDGEGCNQGWSPGAHGFDKHNRPDSERMEAEEEGWTYDGEKDLCPECSKQEIARLKKNIAQRIRTRKPYQWYEVVPEGTTDAILALCDEIEDMYMNPEEVKASARKLREALTTQEQAEADTDG